ncbi:MAG: GGDEF domain-containing protein [Methylocystaceae bacterium]|nr:GGDEF domain-containing protein [Methylocystaceae bacterium]
MTRISDTKTYDKDVQFHSESMKLDLIVVAFANLGVLLIASQVDLSYWLDGLTFSGADIFIPLTISLSLSLVYLLERKRRLAIQERDKFMRESRHDNLTGLYNRQYLQDSATIELERTKRVLSTFSVILLDIDDFKKINDNEGHNVGDQVLTQFAHVLEQTVRQIDVVARWGGEEFIILCRDTNDQGAFTLAGKVRQALKETDFTCQQNVTASMGVASVEEAHNLEELIKLADQRMYQAKREGKDRIISR